MAWLRRDPPMPVVTQEQRGQYREAEALLEMAVSDMTVLFGGGFGGSCAVAAMLIRRGVGLLRRELPRRHARAFMDLATMDLLGRRGWRGGPE